MRSFFVSAVLIASVLIGQQWAAKAGEPFGERSFSAAQISASSALANWAKGGAGSGAARWSQI